jgi:CheY-like chemotaxis protein
MKKKILMVEDNPADIEVVTTLLKDAGFDVSTATDGDEGLHKAKNGPDLILMDVVLPKDDGFTITSKLKSGPLRDIPVVILTTLDRPGDVIKGLEANADGFLNKNVAPDEFLRRVTQVLSAVAMKKRGEFPTLLEVEVNHEHWSLKLEQIQIAQKYAEAIGGIVHTRLGSFMSEEYIGLIYKNVVKKLAVEYPFLKGLTFDADGRLRGFHLGDGEVQAIRRDTLVSGLDRFASELLGLISTLIHTGDVEGELKREFLSTLEKN